VNRKQREKCYNAFENLMHDAYKIRIKILTGQNLRYDNTNEFFHHHSSIPAIGEIMQWQICLPWPR